MSVFDKITGLFHRSGVENESLSVEESAITPVDAAVGSVSKEVSQTLGGFDQGF